MKKIIVFLGLFFISGCLFRTYTVERERQNTDVSGNQGYLMGEAKGEPKKSRLGKTRTTKVFEFEFGRGKEDKNQTKPDSFLSETNSTYNESKESSNLVNSDIDQEIFSEEKEINLELDREFDLNEEIDDVRPEYLNYKIEKNDTLQKISKKFFGTTREWKMIYELNKDIIKNPNRVYPGKTIKIPLTR